jgi:septal ring factor EnvC (AmiA/AmiB activator)
VTFPAVDRFCRKCKLCLQCAYNLKNWKRSADCQEERLRTRENALRTLSKQLSKVENKLRVANDVCEEQLKKIKVFEAILISLREKKYPQEEVDKLLEACVVDRVIDWNKARALAQPVLDRVEKNGSIYVTPI